MKIKINIIRERKIKIKEDDILSLLCIITDHFTECKWSSRMDVITYNEFIRMYNIEVEREFDPINYH